MSLGVGTPIFIFISLDYKVNTFLTIVQRQPSAARTPREPFHDRASAKFTIGNGNIFNLNDSYTI